MQLGNTKESLKKRDVFFSDPVATLKQVIFSHMLSREVHVEADDSRHSGASEGQQGGAEEPSASCLLADSQRENTPPQVGQTEASDTAERNGEAANRKIT